METVLQIAAVCLVGAVLAAVLRQRSPEAALLLGLAVCAAAGALLLRGLAAVLDMLEDLAAAGGLPPELLAPLVKTLRLSLPLAELAGACYNFCVYFAAEPQLMGQNPALYENVSRLVQFWL